MKNFSRLLKVFISTAVILIFGTCRANLETLQEQEVTAFSGSYYNETRPNPIQELVVTFSKPVFSLSDYDTMTNEIIKKLKITVSPGLRGQWRPIGTQAAAYVFTERPTFSTHYTVTLNADEIRSLEGQPVTATINYQDVTRNTYTFDTRRVSVTSCSADSQFTNTLVRMSFSIPVPLANVRNQVTISDSQNNPVVFTANYQISTNSFESNGIIIARSRPTGTRSYSDPGVCCGRRNTRSPFRRE
jgi:hypothetical protein